jgi:hypothetical protein
MLRRIFMALALASMVNLAALAGLVGYAGSRQWLSRDRLIAAFDALRGESADPAAPTTAPAVAGVEPGAPAEGRRRDGDEDEIARVELDRRSREVQDGWKLLESQQLALVREKEAIEADLRRRKQQEQELARRAGRDGLQKELDIIAGLKPKQAKELLRGKTDAEVVRLMRAMEERKARKIVGECKNSEERQWIGRILGQLRENDASQAEVLAAGK